MSTTERGSGAEPWDGQPAGSTADPWAHAQASPDFRELRKRLRGFVFPMTAAFLIWYLAYVLLASYAPGFMARPVLGNINIGLIIGLLQFVTTFAITTAYVSFANRKLDPLAEKIRHDVEGDTP